MLLGDPLLLGLLFRLLSQELEDAIETGNIRLGVDVQLVRSNMTCHHVISEEQQRIINHCCMLQVKILIIICRAVSLESVAMKSIIRVSHDSVVVVLRETQTRDPRAEDQVAARLGKGQKREGNSSVLLITT